MFAILFLLLAISALALLWLIDSRVYEGFSGAPHGAVQRIAALTAIPAVTLWIGLAVFRKRVFRSKAPESDYALGDIWSFIRWAFSRDEA